MVDKYGFGAALTTLAKKYWFCGYSIAEGLRGVDFFAHAMREGKKPLTIAAYYRKLYNGGTQRVVANLCNIWSQMKDEAGNNLYNVVLITDEKSQNPNDYRLNENVKRAFLPHYNHAVKGRYKARFEKWQQILTQYDIDVVVSSKWTAPCLLWDMLSVKGRPSKPAFVVHFHNFCAVPYQGAGSRAHTIAQVYRLCDGVVALSECDRRFMSAFSSNVKCIINPIEFKPNRFDSSFKKIAFKPRLLASASKRTSGVGE